MLCDVAAYQSAKYESIAANPALRTPRPHADARR